MQRFRAFAYYIIIVCYFHAFSVLLPKPQCFKNRKKIYAFLWFVRLYANQSKAFNWNVARSNGKFVPHLYRCAYEHNSISVFCITKLEYWISLVTIPTRFDIDISDNQCKKCYTKIATDQWGNESTNVHRCVTLHIPLPY